MLVARIRVIDTFILFMWRDFKKISLATWMENRAGHADLRFYNDLYIKLIVRPVYWGRAKTLSLQTMHSAGKKPKTVRPVHWGRAKTLSL